MPEDSPKSTSGDSAVTNTSSSKRSRLESLRDLNPDTLRLKLAEGGSPGSFDSQPNITTPESSGVLVYPFSVPSGSDSGISTPFLRYLFLWIVFAVVFPVQD